MDFRYHLVSLVAVFMALATGVLVGSSLLNQSLIDRQSSQITALQGEKNGLRSSLDAAQGQIAYRDNYLAELRGTLLPGRLIGHRVTIVVMPGASGKDVDTLARTLNEAGAQIAGRVALNDDFFADANDPESAAKAKLRDETVRKYSLAAVKSKAPAAQLAAALLAKDSGRALEPGAEALLVELDRAGLVGRTAVAAPGDLAVLVTGPTPPKGTPVTDRRRSGSVALAEALDSVGNGAVVVGPLEETAGAVQAVRRDASVADDVSTVDNVDTPFGLIATVYALVEQLSNGAGQYGAGGAPLPKFRTDAKP
ncbi:MAG: copper transporter [Sporichthyaceae bacterium]